MEALGINLTDIVIYLVLFAGVYLVINKYLVGPLIKMIDKRKAEIKESAKIKESLVEEASLSGKNRNEILIQAKADAKTASVMIEGNAHGEAKAILDKANAEAERIIAKANDYLNDEKAKLQQEMADKVEAGVHRALAEIYNIDKKDLDRALIDKVLKELS